MAATSSGGGAVTVPEASSGVHLLTASLDMSASNILLVPSANEIRWKPYKACSSGQSSIATNQQSGGSSVIIPKLGKILKYDSITSNSVVPSTTFSKLHNRLVVSLASWGSFVATLDKIGTIQLFDSSLSSSNAKSIFTSACPSTSRKYETITLIGSSKDYRLCKPDYSCEQPSSSRTSSRSSSPASSRSSFSDDNITLYLAYSSYDCFVLWRLEMVYSSTDSDDASVVSTAIESSVQIKKNIIHMHAFKDSSFDLLLNVFTFDGCTLAIQRVNLLNGQVVFSVILLDLRISPGIRSLNKDIVACSSDIIALYLAPEAEIPTSTSTSASSQINYRNSNNSIGVNSVSSINSDDLNHQVEPDFPFYIWKLEKSTKSTPPSIEVKDEETSVEASANRNAAGRSSESVNESECVEMVAKHISLHRHIHRGSITAIRVFSNRDNRYLENHNPLLIETASKAPHCSNSDYNCSYANIIVTGSEDHSVIVSSLSDDGRGQSSSFILNTIATFYHKAPIRCMTIKYSYSSLFTINAQQRMPHFQIADKVAQSSSSVSTSSSQADSRGSSDCQGNTLSLTLISCSDLNELKVFNISKLIRNIVWSQRKSFAIAINSYLKKRDPSLEGNHHRDEDGSMIGRHKIFSVVDICSIIASYI